MFDLHAIEKGGSSDKMFTYTFQAMTEDEFEGWVSITGGQISISKPESSLKTEMQSTVFDTFGRSRNNHRLFLGHSRRTRRFRY